MNIRRGMSGDTVTSIQQRLVDTGALKGRADGDFGGVKSIPDGGSPESEVARMRAVANRRAAAARADFVDDVRTRKLTIAEGTGTVHGIFYDLEDMFAITLKPNSDLN
jgi:hypothetical protein